MQKTASRTAEISQRCTFMERTIKYTCSFFQTFFLRLLTESKIQKQNKTKQKAIIFKLIPKGEKKN